MSSETGLIRASTAVRVGAPRVAVSDELVEQISRELGGARVDICLLFASQHYEDEIDEIAERIATALKPRCMVGVGAEAVICGAKEYEDAPAITLWAAHLPTSSVSSFHISEADLQRFESPQDVRDHIGVPEDAEPALILMGDPYSFDPRPLLNAVERAYPGRPAVGGMGSGAQEEGKTFLIFDGEVLHHGLVGIALCGGVRLDTVVSQGCRPIGRHMIITKAERNVIFQLGGRKPTDVLNELLSECDAHDMELLKRRGLLIGCVINEYRQKFAAGDFLIRNPIGIDNSSGAMAVNDLVRTGQTVQFHVRDSAAATEDLRVLLDAATRETAAGALLFSCNGRGTRLFHQKHHDARALYERLNGAPIAGFFCAGEIGPIAQRNFLHGHTAAIALLRPSEPADGG